MQMIGPVDPEERTWEKVILWALMVYAGLVVAWLGGPHRGTLRAWLATLRDRFCPRCTKPEEEAREKRIKDECKKRRVERFRLFLVLSVLMVFYHVPSEIALIHRNRVNTVEVMMWFVFWSFKTTVALFSSRLTPRAVDASYCFFVAMAVTFTVVHDKSAQAICQFRVMLFCMLLFWGLATLKPWLNGLGFLCVALAEHLMLSLTDAPLWMILHTWFVYPLGFVVLLAFDFCIKQGVRMEILAADSETELEAINKLLDSICDVTVHLDRRLRLKQHSPKLADVLMIQAAGRTLEGQDLREHMASDSDRAIFTNCVEGSRATSAHVSVFHAKMRDSIGTSIDMEFFSVGFKGRDGDQHHILGIREFTDGQPVRPPQRLQPEPDPAPPAPPVSVVGAPLALPLDPPPPMQLVPGQEAGALTARDRVDGIGTPAGAGYGRALSRMSSSIHAPFSDSGDPVLDGALSEASMASRPLVETSDAAKVLTINYLLTSWALKVPEDACCPKHAALRCLRSTLSRMKSVPCDDSFGPVTGWQCRRCGIQADEYRDRRQRRTCFLCKDFVDSVFQPSEADAGGSSKASL